LRSQEPYKSLLDQDFDYFKTAEEETLTELLAAVYANRTQAEYEAQVQQFFTTAEYPPFGVPVTEVTYLPMVKLLNYLRDNGFQTWICLGGGIDLMRQLSESFYGVPPQQVIGSHIKKEWADTTVSCQFGDCLSWRSSLTRRVSPLASIFTLVNARSSPLAMCDLVGILPI